MTDKVFRRDVLQGGAALAVVAVWGVTSCGKKPAALSCVDTSGLSDTDLQVRTTLQYADRSADPTRTCAACQQFLPAGPNACGSCKVVKGPINPRGSCKSFLAKTAAA